MRSSDFNASDEGSWSQKSAKDKVYDILDFASRTHNDIQIKALPPKTTVLRKINISETDCDRTVRVLINKKIRRPNGWNDKKKGSITRGTKISECIEFGEKP